MATYYTVQRGDTLRNIAAKFQVSLQELIAANPQITNINLIYPNQVITIPQVTQQDIDYRNQVIELTNRERTQRGLNPLSPSSELNRVAQIKSEDMSRNNYFGHNSPVYGSPFDMMRSFGIRFTAAAENIARGQRTPRSVVNAWMNSPGHRANILNSNFNQIGVGYYNAGTPYWTQMFIKS